MGDVLCECLVMNKGKTRAGAKKLVLVKVYHPDGTVEEFQKPKSFFDLEWYQEQVGGSVESVPCQEHKGHVLVVNEDGLIKGLPSNFAFAKTAQGATLCGSWSGNVILVPEKVWGL